MNIVAKIDMSKYRAAAHKDEICKVPQITAVAVNEKAKTATAEEMQ